METRGPVSGSIPISAARPDAASSAWQVGQILRATTLSSTPGGQTLLQVGTQTLQAQSPVPLTAGQTVSLQVESLTPQPLLRILPAPGTDSVGDAIRTLLPRQGGLAPLLNNLVQLGNARPTVLPPLLQELSRALLRQLPDTRSVTTAPGLRQAVAQSGLFQEARLLSARDSGRVNLGSDLKTNLLRLVQLVRNWPGVASGNTTGGRAMPAPVPTSAPSPAPGQPPLAPTASSPAPGQPALPLPMPTPSPLPATATTPPPVPGTTPQAAPGHNAQPAAPVQAGGGGNASPANLGRGLRAAIPLPTGAPSAPPAPGPTLNAPASALARVWLTGGLGLPPPPPPPLRGQPPQPQARGTASLQALQPAPLLRAELLQQAEASLARLQLNQLASLPQGRDTGLEWLLDLPVRRGEETDIWSLGIRRDEGEDGRDPEQQGPLWTVQLAFDLPGLGPMQARVSLRGEQVSTWFWATREETMPLLQDHLRELRRELEASGLRVGELHCLRGPMPGNAGAAQSRRPILDERV
jgi:hypothetical protein